MIGQVNGVRCYGVRKLARLGLQSIAVRARADSYYLILALRTLNVGTIGSLGIGSFDIRALDFRP